MFHNSIGSMEALRVEGGVDWGFGKNPHHKNMSCGCLIAEVGESGWDFSHELSSVGC